MYVQHVAASHAEEAAARIVSNRQAIVKDALARKVGSTGAAAKEPFSTAEVEEGLRAVSAALIDGEESLDADGRALAVALGSLTSAAATGDSALGAAAAAALAVALRCRRSAFTKAIARSTPDACGATTTGDVRFCVASARKRAAVGIIEQLSKAQRGE